MICKIFYFIQLLSLQFYVLTSNINNMCMSTLHFDIKAFEKVKIRLKVSVYNMY